MIHSTFNSDVVISIIPRIGMGAGHSHAGKKVLLETIVSCLNHHTHTHKLTHTHTHTHKHTQPSETTRWLKSIGCTKMKSEFSTRAYMPQ